MGNVKADTVDAAFHVGADLNFLGLHDRTWTEAAAQKIPTTMARHVDLQDAAEGEQCEALMQATLMLLALARLQIGMSVGESGVHRSSRTKQKFR